MIKFRLTLAMLTFLGGQFATVIPVAHALNTTGGTTTTWGSSWGGTSWSVENFRGTNDVTYDVCLVESDGVTCQKDAATNDITINIPAPKFEITEKPAGKYEVFYKGIVEVTHAYSDVSPVDGRAWAEIELHWPEVSMQITSSDPYTADGVTITKENRRYYLELEGTNSVLDNNGKVSGSKKIVPYLYHDGEYSDCDGSNIDPLCETKITYGTVPFDPLTIFPTLFNASGDEVTGDIGLEITQVCFSTSYEDAGIDDPNRLDIQSKNDDVFYSCEGLSIVARACADYDGADDCNDTNGATNEEGERYTFVLNGAFGYNLKTPPAVICIGPDGSGWDDVAATSGTDREVIIVPCDPNQGYIPILATLTDTMFAYANSGDKVTVEGLNIIAIVSSIQGVLQEPVIYLGDNPDQYNNWFDFSNIKLDVLYIRGNELDDTIITSPDGNVAIGDNGNDDMFGSSGDDCLSGGPNDDILIGDGHPSKEGYYPYIDPDNLEGIDRGSDIFVLNKKLGKDWIKDFYYSSDVDGERDMIVNLAGTSSIACSNGTTDYTTDITCDDEYDYLVYQKGQNHTRVSFVPGSDPLVKGVNVIDASSLSAYSACNGYPQ